jgi:hypothetical protein
MTKTKEPFSITICFRHPSLSPEKISEVLSLKPEASWVAGQRLGKFHAKKAYFSGCLQKGNYASELEGALVKVVLFLEKHTGWWTDFLRGKGEADLTLNLNVHAGWEEGDKCFGVYLAPTFLSHLSTRGIGLSLQGWQKGVKTKKGRI